MKYQYLYDSVLKTSIPVDEFKDEAEVAELLGHIGDAIRIWATLAKFGDKNAQTRLDDLTQGKDVYFAGCGEGINQNLCPHVHFDFESAQKCAVTLNWCAAAAQTDNPNIFVPYVMWRSHE